MSIMVHSFQACEVGEWNEEIAHVNANGVVTIYPQGIGAGPSISMDIPDWLKIMDRTTKAVQAWIDKRLGEAPE